jgi:hypothetical protein
MLRSDMVTLSPDDHRAHGSTVPDTVSHGRRNESSGYIIWPNRAAESGNMAFLRGALDSGDLAAADSANQAANFQDAQGR